nr:MAG TPA: hypothetical protein [Caudoviricetes sp.]
MADKVKYRHLPAETPLRGIAYRYTREGKTGLYTRR